MVRRRSQYAPGAADPSPEESQEWSTVFSQFKNKVTQFGDLYNRLVASDTTDPKLKAEREKLLSTGSSIRNKVSAITGAVDTAYNWLKSTIGLGDMGVIPLVIPVVAAAGTIALMTAWISNVVVYFDKADRWEKIAAQYGTKAADKAMASIDAPFLGGATDMIKALLPFLAMGAAAYFFRDKLFKGR